MKIQAREVGFAIGKQHILQQVGFEAYEGEILAVLGQNGAGKSTLFRCILGLEKGYTGQILAENQDLRKLSPGKRAQLMAYIPQKHGDPFSYTVEEIVLMGTALGKPVTAVPGRKERERCEQILKHLELDGLRDRIFNTLSGGEQQMVLIARALVQQARILVMDEPTSNLDYGNQTRVFEILRKLAGEGYLIILSTHNPQQVLFYADRVLALQEGKVLAAGKTEEVMTSELIKELYHMEAELIRTESGMVLIPKRERIRCKE